MQRELVAPVDVDEAHVVDLTHARDGSRCGVGALARVAPVARLDVHDDVASRAAPAGPPPRPRRQPRAPSPTGDVGETPITTSANCRPAACRIRSRRSSTRGAERSDRRARRLLGIGRSAIHQDVDVPAHQPRRSDQHEHGDEERRERVAVRMACPHEQQPEEDRHRSGQVAREVERVRGERRAPGALRHPPRHHRAARVDDDHDADRGEHVPVGVHVRGPRAEEPLEGPDADQDARSREERRLGERREMLRLPVPVLVRDVGGPARDAEREEA